ncbi:MAG: hypothetical protein IT304_04545 [Dehalococcoidia bacterium]|nr:hypothetical protein [Dehalococcoidia bacterium]
METKRFIGNDLPRLYERVRRELGPDALVVRTRSLLREGAEPLVELIAAPPQAGADLALDLHWTMVDGALGRLQIARPHATIGDLEDLVVRDAEAVPQSSLVSPGSLRPQTPGSAQWPPAAPPTETAHSHRRSFADLDGIDDLAPPPHEWAVRPRPTPPPTPDEPPLASAQRRHHRPDIAAALRAAGLSAAAADTVAREHPRERSAANALAAGLRAADARYPEEGETALITVQGPPGAGRTTALLRLALDCADSGRETLLVAADTARAAGRDQVHPYAEAAGLPVADAATAAALRSTVARARRGACLFADVPAGLLAPVPPRSAAGYAYLALPAHWQDGPLRTVLAGLDGQALAGAILTFTDFATDLSPVLSLLIEARLGLAFLSSGRDVSTGVETADPFALANMVAGAQPREGADAKLAATA